MKELSKKIVAAIKKNVELDENGRIQMFNNVGWIPDYKIDVYADPDATVLYAPGYGYVEVLGVSKEVYDEVFSEIGTH